MRSKTMEGDYTCSIISDIRGVRVLGEARSVSFVEFQWQRFKEWWGHDPDAQMMKGMANLALFVVPEIWAARAAAAGATTVQTVTATSKLTNEQYIARLGRYLRRPGRTVRARLQHGDEAEAALDGALGHLSVINFLDKPTVTMRFAGNSPSRLTIHHEMHHYLDLVKTFKGDGRAFVGGGSIRAEVHVHWKLVNSKRWSSYSAADQATQLKYGEQWLELERTHGHIF
jgi:hypothetical protein